MTKVDLNRQLLANQAKIKDLTGLTFVVDERVPPGWMFDESSMERFFGKDWNSIGTVEGPIDILPGYGFYGKDERDMALPPIQIRRSPMEIHADFVVDKVSPEVLEALFGPAHNGIGFKANDTKMPYPLNLEDYLVQDDSREAFRRGRENRWTQEAEDWDELASHREGFKDRRSIREKYGTGSSREEFRNGNIGIEAKWPL